MSAARRLATGITLLLTLGLIATFFGGTGGAVAGSSCPSVNGPTLTYGFTGDSVQIQVPAGVVKANVSVRGARGGQYEPTALGGHGGFVQGSIPVDQGDCLTVTVGGYGSGTSNFGYGSGGDRGTQWGPGRDGASGGGGSAILVGSTPMVVAAGGGGGGGNGSAYFDGGAGGDGANGSGPGPDGSQGGTGQGVPVNWYVDLGGMPGSESGPGGGGGDDGTTNLFSGAGGGGGGGIKGGGGGANWNFTAVNNAEKPVGGGGGGGGDSYADPSVENVQFTTENGNCQPDTYTDICDGQIVIDWTEQPTSVLPYAGSGQSAPITAGFRGPLAARVLAQSGDPVAGTRVTFRLPSSGAGASFAVPGEPLTATAISDSNGIATSPALVANSNAGSWAASATVASVKAPASFPMKNLRASTATAAYTSPTPSRSGEPVTMTAVVGSSPSSAGPPDGAVSFEIDGYLAGPPVSLSPDGTAVAPPVIPGPGTHQITASFEGSTDFAASHGSTSQTVQKGGARVDVSTSPNPSSEGGDVTLTADVSALPPAVGNPTGGVVFSVDGDRVGTSVPLTGGTADAEYSFDTAGQHIVRAVYSGDDSFAGGNGVTVQSVGDEATVTSLSLSDPAPVFGDPLTLTANVSGPVPPEGEVTFSASSPERGLFEICQDVTLTAGSAGCEVDPSLSAGDYELIAGFQPAPLGVEPSAGRNTVSVLEATAAVAVVADPDPVRFGSGYRLDAQAVPVPDAGEDLAGSMSFSVDGGIIGTPVPVTGGNASLPDSESPPLAAGAHAVGALYTGDRDFRPAGSAGVLVVDPADTEIGLSSNTDPVGFRKPVTFTAMVTAVEPVAGTPGGAVQFWADGEDLGNPVELNNGTATYRTSSLSPGEHDVRAYYASSGDFRPSEARLDQGVDSRPPAPKGILPCADRRLVLTAAYRFRDSIRFEGVARFALRGRRIKIKTGGDVISQTTVRPDGTFWAGARDGADRFRGRTRFRAVAGKARSWPRRLGQAIRIVRRSPRGTSRRGNAPRIEVALKRPGHRAVQLVRQVGCRKHRAKILKMTATSLRGRVSVGLPRPGKGRPYAIYRLRSKSVGTSSPIVVRSRE